jgi:Tol biopolymer transport system component
MLKKGQLIMLRLVFAAVAGVFAALLAVSVIHAQPAPEGQIAFVSERDGDRDIFLINADGTDERNLTNAEGRDERPVWSPDGRYLAYVSERDGNPEIYVMDMETDELINVSNDEAWDTNPAWSPDGDTLLFNSTRDSRWQMYTVKRDGSDLQRLVELDGSTYASAWSPDGELIAFTWGNGYSDPDTYNAAMLTVVNADGSNVRELAPMDAEFPRVTWSPDSRQITYNAYDADIPFDANLLSTWSFIYNLDDDSVTPVFQPDETSYRGENSDVTSAQWSPDGEWMSFSVGEYVGDRIGFATYALEVGAQDARQILGETAGADWSPDSQWLAVISDGWLYVTDPRTGDATLLADEGRNYSPAWRPAASEQILWEPTLDGALLS